MGTDDIGKRWGEHLMTLHNQLNDVMERVFDARHGQPVAEISGVLAEEFATIGVTFTDAELLPYAEEISAGNKVVFRLE